MAIRNVGGGEARTKEQVIGLFEDTIQWQGHNAGESAMEAFSIAQDLLEENNISLAEASLVHGHVFLQPGTSSTKESMGKFVLDDSGLTQAVQWFVKPRSGSMNGWEAYWKVYIAGQQHGVEPYNASWSGQLGSLAIFHFHYDAIAHAVQFAWSIAKFLRSIDGHVPDMEMFDRLEQAIEGWGEADHPYESGLAPLTPESLLVPQHGIILQPRWPIPSENPAPRGGPMSRDKIDPGVSPRAIRMFRGFHKRDWRSAGDFSPELVIPDRVTLLGDAKHVLYKSDKLNPETEVDEGWINYIHEHDRGVRVFRADREGRANATVAVPAWIRKQAELVWLGDCNGFAYWDGDGTEREVKGTKPYPGLYTTPNGKALLVIQNKRTLLAMFWGGRLGVEPRGIVH